MQHEHVIVMMWGRGVKDILEHLQLSVWIFPPCFESAPCDHCLFGYQGKPPPPLIGQLIWVANQVRISYSWCEISLKLK